MGPMMDAIQKTAEEIPSLAKADRNIHGGFNYVPIDTFYEVAARAARLNGLIFKVRETSVTLHPEIGKHGIGVFSYEFDLMHAPTGTVWNNYFRCSTPHPFSGAQMSGSALSYAVKQFFRTSFAIVTGEGDADATDPKAMETDEFGLPVVAPIKPAPLKEPVLQPTQQVVELKPDMEADAIYKLLSEFLPLSKSEDDLKDYWNKNTGILNKLKAMDLPKHKDLVSKFKARIAEIKQEKNNAH